VKVGKVIQSYGGIELIIARRGKEQGLAVCSVNIHKWQLNKLDKICSNYGSNRSGAIRDMLDMMLDFYDEHGVALPDEEITRIFMETMRRNRER